MSATGEERVRDAGDGESDDGLEGGAPNTDGPGGIHVVAGERGIPSVNRARSLQSRMSSMLAIALMGSLGVGLLAWYYARVLTHPARALESARTQVEERASGNMALPAFGPISSPLVRIASPPSPPAGAAVPGSGAGRMTALQALLGPAPVWPGSAPGIAAAASSIPAVTPAQRAFDRRLLGPPFASASSALTSGGGGDTPRGSSESAGVPPSAAAPGWLPFGSQEPMPGVPGGAGGADPGPETLANLLRPEVTPAVEARVLPTERFLLPKGAFIDCTLETAIDSTLPGMTTCVTATDTLSADGTVVLLSRGTKLVGETRGEVAQGQSRIFVLWSEARTPSGVVVPLDSPGTDALGRSGLSGSVERHFWERFGAAILVSVIDGAVQAGVQSTSRGGTVLVNPSGSEDVMTGILQSSVDIPPTIVVPQGARIQVLVARDVDFRSVYRLVPVKAQATRGAP
jgi:type IV secretion system protein VirB10